MKFVDFKIAMKSLFEKFLSFVKKMILLQGCCIFFYIFLHTEANLFLIKLSGSAVQLGYLSQCSFGYLKVFPKSSPTILTIFTLVTESCVILPLIFTHSGN